MTGGGGREGRRRARGQARGGRRERGGVAALLLAAGRGERLGGDVPKAFVEVGGRTLLAHAVSLMEACPEVDGFVVAAPAGREPEAEAIAGASGKLLSVVAGGPTRQSSVLRALRAVPPPFGRVLCHDVARPLARPALASAVLAAVEAADGAVPCVPVPDTVKRLRGGEVVGTLSRDELGLAQTPQAFRRDALEAAHQLALEAGVHATDDAALLERAGFRVAVVPGDSLNLKVTSREDVRLAEALLAERAGRSRG